MDATWFDDTRTFLGPRCPLPLDRPFTAAMAATLGVSRQSLRTLIKHGFVRAPLRDVYAASQAPDDMMMRARAVALVLPPEAVVTDRTAAWLHGVDILPRNSRLIAPPVQAFHRGDKRTKRQSVASGRRGLRESDITRVHGIPVTTPLRTALDLGRGLRRHDALGAIDAFLRLGVPHELMSSQIDRFKGFRGVVQLRRLVPLGDGRSESMGESALRMDWYDAGLPRPELQFWVFADDGTRLYRLDIALPELLYAAEYDGEEHHTDDADVEHDEGRREWCRRERGWHFEIFTKGPVYGRDPDPIVILQNGLRIARSNQLWTPYGGARPTPSDLWTP